MGWVHGLNPQEMMLLGMCTLSQNAFNLFVKRVKQRWALEQMFLVYQTISSLDLSCILSCELQERFITVCLYCKVNSTSYLGIGPNLVCVCTQSTLANIEWGFTPKLPNPFELRLESHLQSER